MDATARNSSSFHNHFCIEFGAISSIKTFDLARPMQKSHGLTLKSQLKR